MNALLPFTNLKNVAFSVGLSTLLFSGVARAQVLDLTSSGTAIEGVDSSSDYSQLGTSHFHAGDQSSLTDGSTASPNVGSESDTFNDTAPYSVNGNLDDSSYIGFTFAAPTASSVTGMTVNFFLYGDGGWFGKHNTPGTSPLASVVLEPIVQVFNGTSWTTVSDSSNYLAVVGADNISSNHPTGTVTFTLAAPISGIQGIRVTGLSGGTAGDQHGFIGVADERVFGSASVPEPSTYALIGLGVLALAAFGRLRKSGSLA